MPSLIDEFTRALRRLSDRDAPSMWWVVLGAFAILAWLLAARLAAPPFWDAAWSTSVGAVELSRNGFDYPALLSAAGFREGGPGTHAGSLLTPLLGVFFSVFGSTGGLVAGHILMIALGSVLAGATYVLGRRHASWIVAVMAAGVVTMLPVVLQQIADPYVEIPLALLTVLTVLAVQDGNRARATLFTALAIWVKPTGFMLVPLILLMGEPNEPRRWLKNAGGAVVAVIPFSLRLMSPSNILARDVESTLEGTMFLLRNAAVGLASMIDVLVILVFYVLGSVRLWKSHGGLVRNTAIVTAGFFAILLYTIIETQGVTILPRYYVAVLPLWVLVMAAYINTYHSRHAAVVALVILATFALANWDGRMYLLDDHPHPVMAERSPGGGSEYLQLEILGTRALVDTADNVDVLLVGREMHFRLGYPELGFVQETPQNIISISDVADGSELTDLVNSFAVVDEPHGTDTYAQLIEEVVHAGCSVERTPITHGRWTSELFTARCR